MSWATGLAEVSISEEQKIQNIVDTEKAKAEHLAKLSEKRKSEGHTNPVMARAFGHRFKKYTTAGSDAVAGSSDDRALQQYKKKFGNRR